MYVVVIAIPGHQKIMRVADTIRQIEQRMIDVMMEHFAITGGYRDILDQVEQIKKKVQVDYYLLDIETGEGYPFALDLASV